MKYKIILQDEAIRSLESIYAYISRDNPAAALRHVRDLQEKCETLSRNPRRCPLALEDGSSRYEIRNLIYGHYRVIFTISDKTVHILEIRHAARQPQEEPLQ